MVSHLADPGRLEELLIPGVELYLRPAAPGSGRKTCYSTILVRQGEILVSLVSALPNQFVGEELAARRLPLLRNSQLIRPEVSVGKHRFDFLLEQGGKPFYLEVKSVTYVENGVARFPDAVSERAARHADALAGLARSGIATGILFVCQRQDADCFRPFVDRDPRFAAALATAGRAGVRINCITTRVTLEEITYYQEIPVVLD